MEIISTAYCFRYSNWKVSLNNGAIKSKFFLNLIWKFRAKIINFWLQNKRLFVTVFIVIFFVDITVATLDLSNVDWHNFQFFRYQKMLPYGELKNVPPPPPSITDHIQKASAGKKQLTFSISNELNGIYFLFLQLEHMCNDCYLGTRLMMEKQFRYHSHQLWIIYVNVFNVNMDIVVKI